MKIALFAYTRDGIQTGKRIIEAIPDFQFRAFAPERIGIWKDTIAIRRVLSRTI